MVRSEVVRSLVQRVKTKNNIASVVVAWSTRPGMDRFARGAEGVVMVRVKGVVGLPGGR